MTPTGALPTNLVAAAAEEPALARWVATLPAQIEAGAARWSLKLGVPYQPGGAGSWVAPATDGDGAAVVVKLTRRHPEGEHETDGLRLWAERGAVRLLGHARLDEHTDALLLEACVPGTPAAVLADAEQDELVAAMLRRVWRPAPVSSGFRPLTEMCDQWADGLDVTRAVAAVGDAGLVRAGTALFRELPREVADPTVLVTDLHAGNLLRAQREPWLLIDPKPYLGDRAYDPLQHLLNGRHRLERDPRAAARRMAGLLDLDPERLTRWLFARCVIDADEQPWLGCVARSIAPR